MQGGMCSCPHHKIGPLAIFLIGLVFLLQALGVISMELTNLLWPILLMVMGLMKMSGGMCACCGTKK